MDSSSIWFTHLEAIKLLKEWNSTLVVIQIGAIAVIGGIYKGGAVCGSIKYIKTALIAFLTSILVSASLIGAIPFIVQNFPENYNTYGNIYKMQNIIGIPIFIMATAVHGLFIIGLIAFGLAVYKNISHAG